MAVSPDTLIRLIRKTPEPEMETPKVLGIDEWAKRKGQSYGTILVDLEKHRTMDLLPEKSSELLVAWLKEHPGIEVISRDRGTEYIKGVTEGAPGALQVVDRWHLLSNLKDALKRMLEGKRAALKAAAESDVTDSEVNSINTDNKDMALVEPSGKLDFPNPEDAIVPALAPENFVKDSVENAIQKEDTPRQLTKVEQEKKARHERRQERYEKVRQLRHMSRNVGSLVVTMQTRYGVNYASWDLMVPGDLWRVG